VNSKFDDESSPRSATWIKKGLATIARMRRENVPPVSSRVPNPLRDIFTDLMAYVIFFESACGQQPPVPNEFREKILALVNAQEERAKSSGVAMETFREARFAVLSWVDEIIFNSSWPHRAQWQHLMLAYHGTLNAGEDVFRHLETLPSHANDIREIYYLCLSLGFEGRYAFGDDRHELRELKQGLYKQLCSGAGDIRQNYPRLFPEAYQKVAASPPTPARAKLLWHIVAFSVPVVIFLCYFFILWLEANRVIGRIKTPLPQLPVSPLTCFEERLRPKGITTKDTSRGVLITLEGKNLVFKPGSVSLDPEAQTKIDDVVDIVKRCAKESVIVVEGHASREKGGDEAVNQQLSEGRARTVANAFKASGFSNDRITARGFGSRVGVAGNETEEGRAKNRRVEIYLQQ
jgi:type VI secretion system protein ImpK